ncbi:hypothetical protein VI06_16760 [Aquitalea magnusonii]|nr:hypothetical protein VI06_16760 [Aquitalea magnusonii]
MMRRFVIYVVRYGSFKSYIKALLIILLGCALVNIGYAILVQLGMPAHYKAQKLLFVKSIIIFCAIFVFSLVLWWRLYKKEGTKAN